MVRKPIAALTLAEWSGVLATNLTALFLLARAGETMLRAAKGGIVTVASTRAHMSEKDTESYSASKGGVVALTHALAVSLGPDVRVNCISPGWIDVQGETLSEADRAQHPVGPGRPAGGRGGDGGVPAGAGERVRDRGGVRGRRWDDAER